MFKNKKNTCSIICPSGNGNRVFAAGGFRSRERKKQVLDTDAQRVPPQVLIKALGTHNCRDNVGRVHFPTNWQPRKLNPILIFFPPLKRLLVFMVIKKLQRFDLYRHLISDDVARGGSSSVVVRCLTLPPSSTWSSIVKKRSPPDRARLTFYCSVVWHKRRRTSYKTNVTWAMLSRLPCKYLVWCLHQRTYMSLT